MQLRSLGDPIRKGKTHGSSKDGQNGNIKTKSQIAHDLSSFDDWRRKTGQKEQLSEGK
jgi:hypothetical protein